MTTKVKTPTKRYPSRKRQLLGATAAGGGAIALAANRKAVLESILRVVFLTGAAKYRVASRVSSIAKTSAKILKTTAVLAVATPGVLAAAIPVYIIKKHFDIARDFRQWKNPDHKKVYVVNK